jgi:L-lactate dehydrogenase complex protein LldG
VAEPRGRLSRRRNETAREEILARVRRAIGSPTEVAIPREYRRTGDLPPGDPALLELLTDRLVDYKATVHESTVDALPATVASVLDDLLPDGGRVVVPEGLPFALPSECAAVPVPDNAGMSATDLDGCDAVLTGCTAAAAETGTIVLDGSAGQGRRAITLVPDRHIVVVRADQVVQTVPELLARLDPQRPLTFISGPSATSDIELQRVEGVHGPRTLVVILVT